MTGKNHDKELDAVKADIASLREDIAGLAAGMKQSARIHAKEPHEAERQEEPAAGEEAHGVWTDLLHKFDSSRVQGEKAFKGLATEVEHRPLVSVMAAFGLGYIIAKLWYQESKE